jgi:type II secretory pathway pseudopilin PulG
MSFVPLAISTFAIVLIVVAAVLAVLLVLGLLGARARDRSQAGSWEEAVRSADAALAQAAATDRGWHRESMESAARVALEKARPGWSYGNLHLVLVDDRPGIEEDRAHFMAIDDDGHETRVVLCREGGRWSAERVD